MMKLTFLFLSILFILDDTIIRMLRKIQFDILARNRNRKSEKEINKTQTLYNKILLIHIGKYLNKYYVKEYKIFNLVYRIYLIAILPQYLIVFIFYYINDIGLLFVLGVLCGVKLVLFFFFSIFFPNGVGHISKYGLK